MKLNALLAGHDHEILRGDPETDITAGVRFDAGRVSPGSLFIAVPGHREGGPEAIGPALARGAAAVLVEEGRPGPPESVWAAAGDVCVVRVPGTRAAAAAVASRYHGDPGQRMDMVAVTGTNGKTSVSCMVESVLRIAENARVGVIGTAGSRIGDELIPMPRSALSTPESPDLQYLLGCMRDRGATSAVLEATSMGLLTHRVDHTFIDVGVFTNLTQDHLDDHGTMESYTEAKLRLFRGLCERAVVNADDPVGARIEALMPGAVSTYAIDAEADYRATDLHMDAFGARFVLHHAGHKYPVAIPVPGRYSVANALATVAACHLLGHELEGLLSALDRLPPIPGRFERFTAPHGASVIVDYAHSPDSLDNVLATIRDFAPGRIITVFGCGGDRDVTKRARMGEIAGSHSDLCVVTSDNPRGEDPEIILDHVSEGLRASGTPFERCADRRRAIAFALAEAGPEDIVLVAGKGSEPFQIVGEELLPFSDMATVRELAGPR
ncbi:MULTISPECIES: UDP-N-acetylmuramoyl-L-alanyl-D-glutamate--2,6-diaminopimelate ligase [Streptomyces]|uniref:UDP-N-acetylmuramoyl-L-alanyl-D-glutamate--2, 6-diaminopimelate ligase n=1 Tax=Streptomyces TaxID=1883 RepID=UPI001D1595A4|nr:MULTISPECIES: UDP-N-acetylmuramoyl-L-alanyl-D-glutamate--2,6-diaminopimelate ligase [Streptomyces]MCC3649973.1 UDP-N-acetylmuramoyl-L-alanyl-D-glutamate--2,6-diaminopimelate ligase [Streptomyces sp. S07_1.15]WSQ75004.1 UDP-N-acetylmuramoyl-L-alanyl-D-glutamate--2,6-diaminopimelate ligase [Streptomyces xinghaiensis]